MNYQNLDKLEIISYPHPVLGRVAEPVQDDEFTPELGLFTEKMADLMEQSHGIGLAAPQVGVLKRIIVISITGRKNEAEVLINPELNNLQGWAEMEEGCLSIPDVRAKVRRYESCTVTAKDVEGNEFIYDATELAATVLQHETDHLNGILFIDRLNTVSRMACRRALRQLEKQYQNT